MAFPLKRNSLGTCSASGGARTDLSHLSLLERHGSQFIAFLARFAGGPLSTVGERVALSEAMWVSPSACSVLRRCAGRGLTGRRGCMCVGGGGWSCARELGIGRWSWLGGRRAAGCWAAGRAAIGELLSGNCFCIQKPHCSVRVPHNGILLPISLIFPFLAS